MVFVQLGREFNRVLRCDVVSHISTIWKSLSAKLFLVGQQDAVENYRIYEFMSTLPKDIPEST